MFAISGNPPTIARVQLFCAAALLRVLNALLECMRRILFPYRCLQPQQILIYKIGNIGDITCAIPACVAVRNSFPNAHITLLTSPGAQGALGARELLSGSHYIDEMIVYTKDDISTWKLCIRLLRKLQSRGVELFIQLPDDAAHFRTLMRNIFFAKFIGSKSACGFVMRFVSIWKKTQVDFLSTETEVESLLGILRSCGIGDGAVRFELPITTEDTSAVTLLLRRTWGEDGSPLIAISPGCKRESNRWPIDRFAALARMIAQTYPVKIIIIGGDSDRVLAGVIENALPQSSVLDATGRLTILQSAELLSRCSLVIANSTGTIHIAAGLGVPCLGFYSVRDILGRWFPYGKCHTALFHRFQKCDYRSEQCIESSITAITVDEAWSAVIALLDITHQKQSTYESVH